MDKIKAFIFFLILIPFFSCQSATGEKKAHYNSDLILEAANNTLLLYGEEASIEVLKKYEPNAPEDIRIKYNIASLLFNIKKYDDCRDYCLSILKIKPDDEKTLSLYSKNVMSMRDNYSVLDVTEKMLALEKKLSLDDIENYVGALIELEEYDKANTVLKKAFTEGNYSRKLIDYAQKFFPDDRQFKNMGIWYIDNDRDIKAKEENDK